MKGNDTYPFMIQTGIVRPQVVKDLGSNVDFNLLVLLDLSTHGSIRVLISSSYDYILRNFDNYCVTSVELVKDRNNNNLRIICHKDEIDTAQSNILKLFSSPEPLCRNSSYMYEYINNPQYDMKINFWWEVEDNWMCSFGDNIDLVFSSLQFHLKKGKLNDV